MNRLALPAFLKCLFLTLSFAIGHDVQSQSQSEQDAEQEVVSEELISIDEMSLETERIAHRMIDLRSVLEPQVQVQEIDSILSPLELKIER